MIKYAYVHDRIIVIGGAEQVLFDLIEQDMPDPEQTLIFTMLSSYDAIQIAGQRYRLVSALPRWIVSFFDRFRHHQIPFFSKLFDYRNLMVIWPYLVYRLSKQIAQYQVDHIVVSSFAVVKNITIQSSIKHRVLYMHSPCMYVYNHYNRNYNSLPRVLKPLYAGVARHIRRRDSSTERYDYVYANSHYTASLVKQIYNISAQVAYPRIASQFIDMEFPIYPGGYPRLFPGPYMLMIGRLVRFARQCDVVIKLCNKHSINLIVMGTGPDEYYLKSLAGSSIHFIGHISDIDTKMARIFHAQGLINLTLESFGIATAECLAMGIPVYGNHEGATRELVNDQSGILVDTDNYQTMQQSLKEFLHRSWDHIYIRDHFLELYKTYSIETILDSKTG